MSARRLAALLACQLAALSLVALSLPSARAAATGVSSPRPSAASRELDRAQALLLIGLANVPLDNGVLVLREQENLTLRIPARLLFELDSAVLKRDAAARAPLAATVQLLKKHRPLQAQIVAYTDSLGGPGVNQSLSEQRAQAVYAALTAAGIAPARLQHHAAGAAAAVASNDTPAGRIENRRVEIEFRRAARRQ